VISLSQQPYPRKHVSHAPEICRCPRCGRAVPRHETRRQWFWEPHLVHPMILVVEVGCYVCPDHPPGGRWFTALPTEYQGGVQYDALTRRQVVRLVHRFKMPVVQAMALAREMLHLPMLDDSTILGWFWEEGFAADIDAFQDRAVAEFSGQMDIDEVYDGQYGQLKATDPIAGRELDYELIEGPITDDHVLEFFHRLKARGFVPEIVTTDGSLLYVNTITQVWPGARHQRCVFHFLKQCNEDLGKAFWAAYHTMPEPPKRKRGRPKKRGRPRLDKLKRSHRRTVRGVRFLVLKRDDRLSSREREVLEEALSLCPPLWDLRRLVIALHGLFGPTTSDPDQAETKRQAILADEDYAGTEAFRPVLTRLQDDDLFRRLTVYLDYDNAEKTSNHVERENREFRKRQKSHYRLRSLQSICSLLDLLLVRDRPPRALERLRRRSTAPTGEEVSRAA